MTAFVAVEGTCAAAAWASSGVSGKPATQHQPLPHDLPRDVTQWKHGEQSRAEQSHLAAARWLACRFAWRGGELAAVGVVNPVRAGPDSALTVSAIQGPSALLSELSCDSDSAAQHRTSQALPDWSGVWPVSANLPADALLCTSMLPKLPQAQLPATPLLTSHLDLPTPSCWPGFTKRCHALPQD